MVGNAAAVDVVDGGVQIGAVVEQTVQDVERFGALSGVRHVVGQKFQLLARSLNAIAEVEGTRLLP